MGLPVPSQPQGFGSYEAYGAYNEPGFLDSLWHKFTSVATTAAGLAEWGVGLYEKITQPGTSEPNALIYRESPRGTPESPNYQIYTPYPRSDNTNKPATTSVSSTFGLSSTMLLALAGVALILFMKKKGRS